MRVLAGDIGGTKTLLELSEVQGDQTQVIARHRYDSAAYDSFSNVVEAFVSRYDNLHHPSFQKACFGVAGPVEVEARATVSNITNLSWQIDSAQLEQRFHLQNVRLVNDFSAIGYGIEHLGPSELTQLQQGQQREGGTRLVIGAGTGLGVALLIWCTDHYEVLGTEGGHVDFAPRDATQIALLDYLIKQRGRAACEDVLSGPGLVTIYRFLHHYRGGDPGQLASTLRQGDAAAAVAMAADGSEDSLARQAMSIFVSIYGATAGNFALSSMALGGVYVAGGIAPKILHHLEGGLFLEAFNDKGKMGHLNRQVPVAVVLNPDVGLIGCRHLAKNL